jgi:hypothetical protein
MNPAAARILLPLLLGLGSSSFGQEQTWTPTGAPSTNWCAIACSADGSQVIAASGNLLANGQIYKSTNSGTNWSLTSAASLHWTSVACSADGTRLIAAAYFNDVYTSTNAGATWHPNNQGSAAWFSVSSSADGSKLYAVPSGNNLLYRSTNSGSSWAPSNPPLTDTYGISSSANGMFALGSDNRGGVATTTNSGVTWSTNIHLAYMPLGVATHVNSSAQAETLAAVVANIAVFTSTNRGVTWTSNALPPSSWLAVCSSADGSKLTAAAQSGLLYSSSDSGNTWTSNAVPALTWQALASSADGNVVFAAVTNGGIWVRRSTPTPVLKLTPSTQGPLVSWTIPSANFILEQGVSLDSPGWTEFTNPPVLNLTNLQNQLTIPVTNGTALYRLRTQ